MQFKFTLICTCMHNRRLSLYRPFTISSTKVELLLNMLVVLLNLVYADFYVTDSKFH